MGIESDRMVFDYLSEVGDLAQQRQLPPGERSALVAGLRDEIDRRRATRGEESPRAVRGILGDLGTPDEVVTRASDAPPRSREPEWWADPDPAAPPSPSGSSPSSASPPPSPSASPSRSPHAPPSEGAAAAPVPHPRGWWHGGPDGPEGPGGPDGTDMIVPGFVGGVEAPELFRPPEPEAPAEEEPGEPAAPAGRARRLARLLRRRRPEAEPAPEEAAGEGPVRARRGVARPFLLLAAGLLVAGAAFGWLLALAAGWLIAYGSRRLTPGQVKRAVFVLPGLAAAGGVAWLWGRLQGRWGEPVPAGALHAALSETWPWTLRAAALLSALYLLHHSRRP
ncbi:hypothetical protein [Streptomyces omiyaensis]|uniref:hypothetical protein n=1 Tax=Streptomyces omiyaensis TaxID=68247 RepID=UPI0036FF6FD4